MNKLNKLIYIMDDLNLPQIGNCIVYRGQLNEFHDRIGKVISQEKMNDANRFEVQIKQRPDGEEQNIWVRPNEINGVFLSKKVLEGIGFLFSEESKTFYFGPIRIVLLRKIPADATMLNNGAYLTKEGGTVFDEGQYHVFEGESDRFKTEADWDENTTFIYSVNALQNYSIFKYNQDLFSDGISFLLGKRTMDLFR